MDARIPFPSGKSLRLRVFPQAVAARRGRVAGPGKSLPLFPDSGGVSRAELIGDRLARQVVQLCLMNPSNTALLDGFGSLGIRDWWLTAGCLFQTVWNLRTGRASTAGIKDYDIFYFADDLSEEAENEVRRHCDQLFAPLGIQVDVRNQARVHLWYEKKFGVAYPQLMSASEGIMLFPVRAAAVAMKRSGDEFIDLFAPFGLDDLWSLIVSPNRSLPISSVYAAKTARWLARWPTLTVHPWAEDEPQTGQRSRR